MRRFRVAVALRLIAAVAIGALGSAVCGAACLPGRGPELQSQFDAEVPPTTSLGGDDGGGPAGVGLGDPLAIIRPVPSHGSWDGRARAETPAARCTSNLRA